MIQLPNYLKPMNRNIQTGLTLTLLMLLLVAGAAFLFLYQGRQASENEAATRTAEQTQMLLQTGSDLAAAEATRDVTLELVATVEADTFLLEADLVASQQELEQLADDLETQTEALAEANEQIETQNSEIESTNSALALVTIEQEAVAEEPPHVQISAPENGALIALDETVSIIVAATDAKGLTAVNLTLNDDPLESHTLTDEQLFSTQLDWTPSEMGEYTIAAMAINSNGIASTPVTVTITVEDVEAQLANLRDLIEDNVIEIRDLDPLSPIEPTLLSSDELRQRTEKDFAENTTPEETRESAISLSAFDFLDRDYDLYQALIDLRSEGVAGFYDPETAEFVVVSDDNEMDADEQWTHAHEFMHALQDQHYPLELIADESLDSEASFALRALAEGEATLVQYLYLTQNYFTEAERDEIFAGFEEEGPAIYDELPPVILNSFIFPYTAGFEFVLYLYNEGAGLFEPGDFEDIEAAWANLPQSTEHILHPELYLSGDAPISVSLPPLTSTLGAGWKQIETDIMGEYFLREYVAQQLSADEAAQAAAGWGGDSYVVFWHEADEALVMVFQVEWDSSLEAAEFNGLYSAYPAGLFGEEATSQADGSQCWQGDDVICLHSGETTSLIVRAPDVETAVLVADTIGLP